MDLALSKNCRNIVELSIAFFTLFVGSSLAGFIHEESNGNGSAFVVKVTIKTLKSCYGNRGYAVGLAGDVDGILIGAFFRQSIPVALFDDTRETSESVSIGGQLRYRLPVFAIVASSSTELKVILSKFRDTIWWNHMASFFILNHPPESDHECLKAREMLWSAWEFNLLNAKFVCLDRDEGRLIYGYNPYTSMAPDPWEPRETHVGKNDHSWTLLALRVQDDEQVCEVLDFDKTKDLAGYEVVATVRVSQQMWTIDYTKTGAESMGGVVGTVAKLLYRAMNATGKLVLHNASKAGMSYENGTDFAYDTVNGLSDIMLSPRYQLTMINFTVTYPHWHAGLGVMTQYSGYLSQLDKISSVVDETTRRGVQLVFFVNLAFFKLHIGQDLTSAILNNIRLICGASVLSEPEDHPARIYLTSLFVFAVTFLALYQGQMASLLTKPVPLPNVNTMQELKDSNYTIYGYKVYATYFNDPEFKGRYVSTDGFECYDYVLVDSTASCVGERQFMIDEATLHNLHVSAETITKDTWVHPIRRDWPLEDRVNVILMRFVEADIVRYWYMKDLAMKVNRLRYLERHADDEKFEVMTLNELSFAFAILGIGLAFGAAVFVVELGIRHFRNQLGLNNK